MPLEAPKTTDPTPLAPVAVTVIGTGPVSGGPDPLATGDVATTPSSNQPNLRVVVIGPLVAIMIRFLNTYLTVLVGLVGAGLTSDIIPANDFMHLVMRCAQLSFAGAGFGLLKDFATVFGKLEGKYPLLTGNV